MTSPTDPPAPNSPAPNPPPFPARPAQLSLARLIDLLLKRPLELADVLRRAENSRHIWKLLATAFAGLALYGLLVGTFSGGSQLLAAPVKIAGGSLLTLLICFPSFYIFAALSGAEISLRTVAGVLAGVMALNSLLLLGFAPVAWVFSQSTESVNFIGALHLAFWFIAIGFALRLSRLLMQLLQVKERVHLRVWTAIFILVSLQMTTALRPIVGKSTPLLPSEKRFFLSFWMENLFAGAETPKEVNR